MVFSLLGLLLLSISASFHNRIVCNPTASHWITTRIAAAPAKAWRAFGLMRLLSLYGASDEIITFATGRYINESPLPGLVPAYAQRNWKNLALFTGLLAALHQIGYRTGIFGKIWSSS